MAEEINAIFKYATADGSEGMDTIYPKTRADNVTIQDEADSGEIPLYNTILTGGSDNPEPTVLMAIKTLASAIEAIKKSTGKSDEKLEILSDLVNDINDELNLIIPKINIMDSDIDTIKEQLQNIDIDKLTELIDEVKKIVNNFYFFGSEEEKGEKNPVLWYETID